MAGRQLSDALEHLRKLVGLQRNETASDGQLLEKYVKQADESAFRSIVQAHGPMVLGVCQRILNDLHAAEDAFQATFLVLARKAASIRKKGSLASWLYGVAYHVALKAKAKFARRRELEQQVIGMMNPEAKSESGWNELRSVLDQELNHLPEKYRAPLVLCYLEGKTNEEAARELGCPPGSMSSRLARGRELLRERLLGRGVTLSGVVLGTLLTQYASAAAVPAALLDTTLKAAMVVSAGQAAVSGAVSTQVASIADGVVKGMFLAKLKAAAAATVAVAVVVGGTVVVTHEAIRHWAAAPATPMVSTPTGGGTSSVAPAVDPAALLPPLPAEVQQSLLRSEDIVDSKLLPPEFEHLAGKKWVEIPLEIRAQLELSWKAKFGEEHARNIVNYFMTIAKEKRPRSLEAPPPR